MNERRNERSEGYDELRFVDGISRNELKREGVNPPRIYAENFIILLRAVNGKSVPRGARRISLPGGFLGVTANTDCVISSAGFHACAVEEAEQLIVQLVRRGDRRERIR